jgi:hypothetical protein
VKQAREVLVAQGATVQQLCRSRQRTARRAAQILHRQLWRKGEDTKAVLRHTTARQVECGRQMMLDDVDGRIVTRDEILEHPTEHGQALRATEPHVALFARPPTAGCTPPAQQES